MSITIEAGDAWFWSDTHFFHKAAAKARGYDTVEDMNRELLFKCRNLTSEDTLFLLGDVSFGKFEETREILESIPARKVLVMGNHDAGLAKKLEKLFDEVHDLLTVKIAEYDIYTGKKTIVQRIICCHYPILSWKDMHYGTWHLHGHSHGSLRWPGMQEGKVLDVGADAFGQDGPVSCYTLKCEMDRRPIVSYDHHKPEKGDWTL